MALDSANDLVYVPAYGNGGFRAFQLDQAGVPVDRQARFITSRASLYGRRSVPAASAQEAQFPGAGAIVDTSTQRFFAVDRFANRILVYDGDPERLADFPPAELVIGQPDFATTRRGLGPNRFGAVSGAQLDEENQRLFVSDGPNNRVLIFDVDPDRLSNDPRAVGVIGQQDLESRDAGIGASSFSRPGSIAYDPVLERLFVADTGNNRVLVFDVDPDDPNAAREAIEVMGQNDFESNAPRPSLDQLAPGQLAYDWRHQRLFTAEDLEHRIMVYDAHPDRIGGPAQAIAVIGQPDAFSTHPAVSDTRIAMPRITLDPENEKLYISEGYPAGNRVTVWDVSPENLETGMAALDVIGHETPDGDPDFLNRMAQGHLDGRSLAAARAVTLDPVDHRLFVPDEYNHRVVVWQLDELNRITDRDARWVLGQPDLQTSLMGDPTAVNMTAPIGSAYDSTTKRIFVGDGYHNRILVYDVAPDQIRSGMPASLVIGQPDFQSITRQAGRNGINFGVRMGRGIASDFLPMGFAVDEQGQRLFVSDGENNRVLIFDIRRDVLTNGPAAIGLLGQADYAGTEPGGGRNGLYDPGHLAFDPATQRLFVIDAKHKRVLVFDVDPERFEDNATAIAVIGRADFETSIARGPGVFGATPGDPPPITGATFVTPNGIAHDPERQLLYIGDGGGTFGIPADRILVFDVHPDRLENGAAAVATLGASSAETPATPTWGGAEPVPGQFRVRDTRGIALDHENGRLFATGSFESRLVQFNFPRSAWDYRAQPGAMQTFATLDAADFGGQSDPASIGTMRIADDAGPAPAAIAVYSRSHQSVDPNSQRHSRHLHSEFALAPTEPARRATLAIASEPGRTHELFAHNASNRAAILTLSVRSADGRELTTSRREVPPREQIRIELESLAIDADADSLLLDASAPLNFAAVRSSGTGENTVMSVVPMVVGARPATRSVAPAFIAGGGYQSELILINPTEDVMEGTVRFFAGNGQRDPLGTRSDVLNYRIAPRASYRFASGDSGRLRRGYVLVEPIAGGPAHAFVNQQHRSNGVLANEMLVAGTQGTRAEFAVELRPTLIRHGDIDARIDIVNTSDESATVSVRLGDRTADLSIAAGERAEFSTAEAFGADSSGVLELQSDIDIAFAARRIVTNITGDLIESELPALVAAPYFPYVHNGQGVSTEFRIANSSTRRIDGLLEFVRPDGEPADETILR